MTTTARRFTCPLVPDHENFYTREHSSEAFRVSAAGVIAPEPTRNSYEGEGQDDVRCADCEDAPNAGIGPIAVDGQSGDPLADA